MNLNERIELAHRLEDEHDDFVRHELPPLEQGLEEDDAQTRYFPSGSNHVGEVEGLSRAGENVGVTACNLGGPAEAALLDMRGNASLVFVDSGAFSEVAFGPNGPKVVRPISPEQWERRLALYMRLARGLGRQLFAVGPDMVGNQTETLARLHRYAETLREIRAERANVIVPVQKGDAPMSVFYSAAQMVLGFRCIAGIPMKKDATTIADLREFCGTTQPRAVHLLGLGPRSPRYWPAVRVIREVSPLTLIYSDSVRIRGMVGREEGKAPRKYTAAQDAARARGATTVAQVKSDGIFAVMYDEGLDRAARALDAGWYDKELFGSWAEAQRATRAGDTQVLLFARASR